MRRARKASSRGDYEGDLDQLRAQIRERVKASPEIVSAMIDLATQPKGTIKRFLISRESDVAQFLVICTMVTLLREEKEIHGADTRKRD